MDAPFNCISSYIYKRDLLRKKFSIYAHLSGFIELTPTYGTTMMESYVISPVISFAVFMWLEEK